MRNYNGLTNKEVRKRISKESSDRLGETRMMNCGEIAFIVEYNGNKDITVQFKTTGELVKCRYSTFKDGQVKSHFTPSVYGVGIIGLEKTTDINGKMLKSYDIWHSMLQRCYDKKLQQKRPTYKECEICKEWLYYKNFKEWFDRNYYSIENQRICLDKDILIKGNKIYSPETCIFVPNNINVLFTKRDSERGKFSIGVCWHKATNKYIASCRVFNMETNKTKNKHLGLYNTPEEAFKVYKETKENNIKLVADYYKEQIPKKLYDAMYRYEVEIDD